MQLVPCQVGTRGFDTAAKVDGDYCRRMKARGYDFAVRYLSLGAPSAADLTRDELVAILDAGLGLMVVQHVLAAGWKPDTATGQRLGASALAHAQHLALPAGMPIWNDLEGMHETTTAAQASACCVAWCSVVEGGQYKPGAYCGAGVPLDGDQLYKLPYRCYWDSQSNNPNVSRRGFQMIQLFAAPYGSTKVEGLDVDICFTQNDYRGDLPLMLVGG